MEVWIESPFDNLPQEGYRAQRYWLMAEAFAEAGHRVVYWTGDFSHASKSKRALLRPVDGKTARLRLIPTLPYSANVSFERLRSHRRYAETWKALAVEAVACGELPSPDLIVASMPTISAAAAALELGKKFGAKTVVDLMDAWPETFYRLLPRPLRPFGGLVFARLHRKARNVYRNADLVTGVCDRYGEMALRLGAKDYHRAYHGIELPPSVPEVRDPGDGVLRLVYAGNLGRTYDLGTVLRAVAEDRKVELDIAGAGPLEEKWKTAVTALGLGGKVRFHGYLAQDALSGLMGECHLGVVPMSAESFVGLPYKLCDYVKSGLGIVGSLEGECGAFVEKHALGVNYRPGDAASLAAAFGQWRSMLKNGCRPDFSGAFSVLGSGSIYRRYVQRVSNETR